MGDSPGRLLSSLSGREGQLPPQMDGCVGVLMHLFHWNSRLQGRKYFSPKLFFSGCIHSSKKKKHYSEKLPMAKLLLIADENCLGESFVSTITDANMSTEDAGSKRTPGVVARLMGLESLPTMEQVKDSSYVQLHSDNDDDTQEFGRRSAIRDSSSSRDFKEDLLSTAESSNVQTPTESSELCLKRTFIEKPFIAGDANRCANRQNIMHPSTHTLGLENVSELSTFPKLFSSWDTVLSFPDVSPNPDDQKFLISKSKQTEILNKKNIDDVGKGPQQQFHGKELCSASLRATGGDLIPGMESLEYKRTEIKCSADIDIPLEVFDSKTSISETSLSTDKGGEDENIGEDKIGSELRRDNQSSEELQYFKAHSAASLPPAIQIGNVDAIKTASTKWFSSKKLEPVEHRLSQNSCKKESRGFNPQQSNGFHSIGAAGSLDMEVKMKAALPCRLKRNNNFQVQNRAHLPATSMKDFLRDTESTVILQRAPFLFHCAKDSCEQVNVTNTGAPRTPNLTWEKNSSIKSKQQSYLPATSLHTVERKKDRLFRSADLTLRKSKKSSEHMIRSCRSVQDNISEHPKVKHDQPKRIVNRGMMMSEGNIHNHYVPPKDGNKGNIPKNDLMHTEKHLESNYLSGCQSPRFSRKLKSMEYQPSRENSACNIRPDSCSGSLEVQIPQRSDHIGRSKMFSKFSSDVKGAETFPHGCMCLSGVDAGCDCIHDKHTVEDVVLEPVIQESKIKEIKEAQIFPTSLLKNVLKVNSQRLSTASKEIVNMPDKHTESSVNDEQSKQTLQHILDSQAGNLVAVNTSTTPESRIPAQPVCNSTLHVVKRRIGAGTFRQELDGGAENDDKTVVASEGHSSCESHNACWREDASGSCLPWNNFKVTTVDDDFESPPIKSRHQRMSVEQADVCETMSDSTCTEDSEQPSPVSVIDSHSPKKFHPRLQKEYQQHLYEYHMKVLQFSSGLPTSEFRLEKCSKVFEANASNNEQIQRLRLTTSQASCHPTGLAENERTNDHCDLEHHIKRVSIASGFQLVNEKWTLPYSHGFLINPGLFEKMEKHQCFHRAIKFLECNLPEDAVYSLRLHRRSKSLRTHHQLLFDCVNEVLDLSLCQSMVSCEHVKHGHSNPNLPGEHIVDVLCKCVSGWQKLSLEAVESVADIELNGTDADWTHFWQEVADITRITEDMVFKDVIEELLNDFIPLQR